MRLIFDLDGTICEEMPTFERSLALPICGIVELLNELHRHGHEIIIYTARSWAEYKMTMNWLDTWEIPYELLICGKPIGDIWIDDKSINPINYASTELISKIEGMRK